MTPLPLSMPAFADFIETVPDAVVVADARGRVRFVNRAAEALFGWSRDEGFSMNPLEKLLPEEARRSHGPKLEGFFAQPARREMAALSQLEAVRKNGTRFPVEIALSPVTLDGERLVVATVRDVTAHRALERQARVDEARIRTLMELAHVGTWELELATDRSTSSPELLRMLGIDRPHASADELFAVVHPDDAAAVQAATQRALQERSSFHLALRVRHSGGGWRWFETRAFVECDDDARPVRIRGLVMDITEQRLAREQLVVNDRLASMGMLAAGVAHEINNPLTAILANLELARDTLSTQAAGALVAGELGDAADAARRIRDLVADLRLFSRADADRARPVDVHAVLETSLRLARHQLQQRATVVTEWGHVPQVLATESRLVQVFLNLLVNAAHAIREGDPEQHRISVATSAAGDGRVKISIRDTGEGMPPQTVARLFTPFFTTKPAGVGTGLGLAICERIVTGFGGAIEVSSAPGEGTEFRVLLPAAQPRPTRSAEPGRARVLLIDDEQELTSAVRRSLQGMHDVEVASSGADAVACIERGERFDIVFCDLVMPEMTGAEVHRAVELISPAQASRFVFVTGASRLAAFTAFLNTVENARIEKPFQIDELKHLIDRHLGG